MVTAVVNQTALAKPERRSRREAEAQPPVNVESLSPEVATDLVSLFKLLSDETRLQILFYLSQSRELNVGTLCNMLNQSQPAVSHHLALMRVAGLIDMRREGKHNFYRIEPSKFGRYRSVLETFLSPASHRDDWSKWFGHDGNGKLSSPRGSAESHPQPPSSGTDPAGDGRSTGA